MKFQLQLIAVQLTNNNDAHTRNINFNVLHIHYIRFNSVLVFVTKYENNQNNAPFSFVWIEIFFILLFKLLFRNWHIGILYACDNDFIDNMPKCLSTFHRRFSFSLFDGNGNLIFPNGTYVNIYSVYMESTNIEAFAIINLNYYELLSR